MERSSDHPMMSMSDGFIQFLEYVVHLKTVRMDFPNFWKQYTAIENVYRKELLGVYVPYDPNSNLLSDATQEFYDVFSRAALLTKDLIHRNMYCDNLNIMTLLRKLFDFKFLMGEVYGLRFKFDQNTIFPTSNDDELDRFPSMRYNRLFNENELWEKRLYKQLKNSMASELLLKSYIDQGNKLPGSRFPRNSMFREFNISISPSNSTGLNPSRHIAFHIPVKPRHGWEVTMRESRLFEKCNGVIILSCN